MWWPRWRTRADRIQTWTAFPDGDASRRDAVSPDQKEVHVHDADKYRVIAHQKLDNDQSLVSSASQAAHCSQILQKTRSTIFSRNCSQMTISSCSGKSKTKSGAAPQWAHCKECKFHPRREALKLCLEQGYVIQAPLCFLPESRAQDETLGHILVFGL